MARITWSSFSAEAQSYAYSQAARKAAGKRITQYGEPEEFKDAYGYLLDHDVNVLNAVVAGNESFLAEHAPDQLASFEGTTLQNGQNIVEEGKTYNLPPLSAKVVDLTIQPFTETRLINVPNLFPTGGSIANILAPVGSPAYNAARANAVTTVARISASTGLSAADLYSRALSLRVAPVISANVPPSQQSMDAITQAGIDQGIIQEVPTLNLPSLGSVSSFAGKILGTGSVGIVLVAGLAAFLLLRK